MCSRAYVIAAKVAGYDVTAISAYADKDTLAIADQSFLVGYDYIGFESNDLLKIILALDAHQYIGFIYGSGFEAQPELLEKINRIIPLIGNSPSTVRALKTATEFFSTLSQCNIPHPKTFNSLSTLDGFNVYLQKFAGGCGGSHIKTVTDIGVKLQPNHYYQQHIEGRPISMLFLADKQSVDVIGINEQWLSPTSTSPFRYGGAVGQIYLPPSIYHQLITIARKLVNKYGLIGLNSLDAIEKDAIIYVLEINPRLSSSFDLYKDNYLSLLDKHIQICTKGKRLMNTSISYSKRIVKKSYAHAIVYATFETSISTSFEWPSWVVDVPYTVDNQKMFQFSDNEPICTVTAYADHSEGAKYLVSNRVKVIQDLFKI